MKRETIKVEKRELLGKKVKKLRREGLLPANVYGKDMPSASIQLPLKDFKELYKKVHETGLVDMQYDGQILPVLIHNLAFDGKSQEVIHADFYKVNLKEKISANIPIVAVGEALAVVDKKGDLLSLLSELEVEALPTDLPEKIEVNIEGLAEVGDQITVEDLKIPGGITVLNEQSQIVFRIGEFAPEEVVEAPAAEGEADTTAEGEATEQAREEQASAEEEK